MKKNNFRELFEVYQLPLYRYLFSMCKNKQMAEDLLQETFYRAMISLKVKDVKNARAWLFKVARNLMIDMARKSKRERKMIEQIQLDYVPESTLGNPEQSFEQKTRQEQIEWVMNRLPERMRSIIYLREIQGFSYKELALALELTENQVKVTLHRAREKFRETEKKLKGGLTDEKG